MDKNMLSAKGLCSIIEACHQAGVNELILGDLQVRFAPSKEGASLRPVPGQSPWLGLRPVSSAFSETCQRDSDLQMTNADMVEMDEALVAHMMIEDPLAYEDHMIDSRMRDLGLSDEDIKE